MNVEDILGFKQHNFVQNINPKAKEKRAYIMLDRRYRNLEINTPDSNNLNQTTTTWYYTQNYNTSNRGFVCNENIRNITSIKINNFFLKTTTPQQLGNMSRMTIFIPELQSQCYLNPNRKFHFVGAIYSDNQNVVPPTYAIMSTSDYGVPVETTSVNVSNPIGLFDEGKGIFRFDKPITYITNLSINFATPYAPYSLHQDTFQFTYADNGLITTLTPHGLQNGLAQNERVYISNFNTTTPSDDSTLISLLNRTEGFLAYGIDDYQIQLTGYPYETISFPNISGVAITDNSEMYADFHRFFIQLELTYIEDLYSPY